MPKEFNYEWTFDLQSPPEALWRLVSDTNRFNRDTGLPRVILLETSKGVKRLKFDLPLHIEWLEEPFEWTFPYHFGILRKYKTGPMEELRADCNMGQIGSRTRLTYKVRVKSRNFAGDLLIPVIIGKISGERFGGAFRKYDEIVQRGEQILGTQTGGQLSAAGKNNLKNKLAQLDGGEIGIRLAEFIERADELSVQQMRPYALADAWGVPRRAALETFLRATRIGILDTYWDILCPDCRGVTDNFSNLKELHGSSHCNACQTDFNASFDENIEVIFRPNESIRKVDTQALYCTGNPQNQPKIVLNKLLVPPHEEMSVGVALTAGRYNVYAEELDGTQLLSAADGGAGEVEIHAHDDGLHGSSKIGLYPRLRFLNETNQPLTFDIVSADWADQAATAADVTTLQVFRDLFSSEVFRPGEEISIGATTLMFTDLRGSTKLYREIGDAPAFNRVREHFDILERAIAAEGGSVVKTIGDAVMAVFRTPGAALRAIWDVQKELTARGEPALMIKVGIHQGPCIAVNLNDRLDYFGSTVNIASRLPGFSQGGEIVFTPQIYDDPEVKEFLKGAESVSKFSGEIRGYDEETELWKAKMG